MDHVARAEPAIAIEVPSIPDRVAVLGVEFVEFAAGEDDAEALVSLLDTLGFRHVARHKSKDVDVYGQGAINLVINTEKEGLAYSSFLMHGTSAYAIGLRVEDAAATVARARALGAPTFEQPHGPGELSIPAIRGVGGGVIYFIDERSELARVWDIEFDPLSGKESDDAGLIRIDHVAQTMSHGEMLTWVLFYTSIFRATKSTMVDVVDPDGIVRSQAVESDDRSLRLTLNGAENRKTLAGRFFAESFGSSIQHIAFATDDILNAAAALRSRGFEALGIAGNYYDDLEARFGLEPEVLEALRIENVLYDRDEGGEYFQIYSQTSSEGFFFEIVERRGAYRGYGAANAPVRIAAQKRMQRAGAPF
jgi:4-hydroxyphenylpyruvate dioxygenase